MAELALKQATIEYQEFGPRDSVHPPVFFVHGVLVNGELWRGVAEELARRGYRCIVPTLPLGSHTIPVKDAAAEAVLAAIAQRGLDHDPTRIRYVQIGSTAGPTITLPAATLRSSGLELLGSGFGSISMERLFASLAAFMAAAGKAAADNAPLTIATATAPLRDVESLWNAPDHGARLVFQP